MLATEFSGVFLGSGMTFLELSFSPSQGHEDSQGTTQEFIDGWDLFFFKFYSTRPTRNCETNNK